MVLARHNRILTCDVIRGCSVANSKSAINRLRNHIASTAHGLRDRIKLSALSAKLAALRTEFRKELAQEILRRDTRSAQQLHDDVANDLSTVLDFAMRVSMTVAGGRTNTSSSWASIIFTKMCINAASLETLTKSTLFDHSAITTISRTLMESMTMYFYLRENVNPYEWYCRELVLKLHDTTSRIKLMRAHQAKQQYDDLIQGQASLKSELEQNSFFKSLTKEAQSRLLTGEQIFVGGMNAAAVRAVGWKQETFLSLYNYFSAHAHSAPMSFMRFDAHKIDFIEPSDTQRHIATLAVGIATESLVRVSVRHLSLSRSAKKQFNRYEIARYKRRDRNADQWLKGEPLSV